MSESDTRAFSFAAVLLLCASALRFGVELRRGGAELAWDTASALPELIATSSAEQERAAHRSRPLDPDERLDPNTASADDLDRLPGVGPAAASAIVGAREAGTRFETPTDLLRVRGIGAATLERIRPHLDLPERARSAPTNAGPDSRTSRRVEVVDLNRAGASELESLPGVGPALAARILEARSRLGRFTSVDQLQEVRGIGPATVERLRSRVRAGR